MQFVLCPPDVVVLFVRQQMQFVLCGPDVVELFVCQQMQFVLCGPDVGVLFVQQHPVQNRETTRQSTAPIAVVTTMFLDLDPLAQCHTAFCQVGPGASG